MSDDWPLVHPNVGTPVRRVRLPALVLAGPAILLAALVYEPWRMTAFPVSDWGGLLTLFRSSDGAVDAFRALMERFGSNGEGRFLPAQMALLAAEWTLVGQDPASWQAIRFIVNGVVIVGLLAFMNRLGVEAVLSAAAVLLLVVASAAPQGWYVPHISEPAGALFLVAGLLLAHKYPSAHHSRAVAFGIALLLACAVLSKEMFLAAIPFVLAVPLLVAPAEGPIRVTRRWVELAVVVAVVVTVMCVVPIVVTRASAPAGAYAGRYSLTTMGLRNLGAATAVMLFPVTREVWFPANLGFFAVLGSAIWLAFRRRWWRRGALILTALTAPLLGALLHAPWPAMEGYYGFAYLPPIAVALGLSLSVIRAAGGRWLMAGSYAAVGALVLYGALFARERALVNRASRELELATVRALGRLSPGDRLVVAVENPRNGGAFSDGLVRYALAHQIPISVSATDIECAEAKRLLMEEDRRVTVLAFSERCSLHGVEPPRWHVERRVVSRDWKTWRRTEHAMQAQLWTPAALVGDHAQRSMSGQPLATEPDASGSFDDSRRSMHRATQTGRQR